MRLGRPPRRRRPRGMVRHPPVSGTDPAHPRLFSLSTLPSRQSATFLCGLDSRRRLWHFETVVWGTLTISFPDPRSVEQVRIVVDGSLALATNARARLGPALSLYHHGLVSIGQKVHHNSAYNISNNRCSKRRKVKTRHDFG
jgi:hypothetical protein